MQADDENRIYVVCSKYVSEGALRSTFALHGEVNEVKLLRDGRGNSRGCAFVTFRDRAGAECAVQACNGTELRGRALKVMMADRHRDTTSRTSHAPTSSSAPEVPHLRRESQACPPLQASHLPTSPIPSQPTGLLDPFAELPLISSTGRLPMDQQHVSMQAATFERHNFVCSTAPPLLSPIDPGQPSQPAQGSAFLLPALSEHIHAVCASSDTAQLRHPPIPGSQSPPRLVTSAQAVPQPATVQSSSNIEPDIRPVLLEALNTGACMSATLEGRLVAAVQKLLLSLSATPTSSNGASSPERSVQSLSKLGEVAASSITNIAQAGPRWEGAKVGGHRPFDEAMELAPLEHAEDKGAAAQPDDAIEGLLRKVLDLEELSSPHASAEVAAGVLDEMRPLVPVSAELVRLTMQVERGLRGIQVAAAAEPGRYLRLSSGLGVYARQFEVRQAILSERQAALRGTEARLRRELAQVEEQLVILNASHHQVSASAADDATDNAARDAAVREEALAQRYYDDAAGAQLRCILNLLDRYLEQAEVLSKRCATCCACLQPKPRCCACACAATTSCSQTSSQQMPDAHAASAGGGYRPAGYAALSDCSPGRSDADAHKVAARCEEQLCALRDEVIGVEATLHAATLQELCDPTPALVAGRRRARLIIERILQLTALPLEELEVPKACSVSRNSLYAAATDELLAGLIRKVSDCQAELAQVRASLQGVLATSMSSSTALYLVRDEISSSVRVAPLSPPHRPGASALHKVSIRTSSAWPVDSLFLYSPKNA